MTDNHNLKITATWREVAGQPAGVWSRLWARLLTNKKEKPPGTRKDASDGEMRNENGTNVPNL